MTGNVTRVPNTTLSHVLLEWAYEQQPKLQNALKELIFQAYYSKDIFLDLEALVSFAGQVGYDANAARAYLQTHQGEEIVRQKSKDAKNSGVTGVPYIIINDEPVFVGAQDPATFRAGIVKAVRN
eukprot:gnl/MRDRNA2_/MRDRNA2_190810_c0_seq1.p1 gnl/MRDRNA2_/MRDRNA2_190810_c0~~gnl/MRDRNA2_/MRDRNA2_190810_c0_seq1.p1  ORF type:complete len:125 (-),score=26.48 gnl/MRDRNA2_/MRDRNA2_190810_c0_seq1:202-576(-)